MKNDTKLSHILKLAWPEMVSQLVQNASNTLEIIFMGPLGTIVLAGVSIAQFFISTISQLFEGLNSGTTVTTAEYLGGKEEDKISKTLNISLTFALSIGIFLTFGASAISNLFYKLAGNESIKNAGGFGYLYIYLAGSPFILGFVAISGFIRGLQDTLTPAIITFIVCIVNSVLDYLLISGKLGFPQLGAVGGALGTVISNIVGFLIILFVMYRKKNISKFINLKAGFKGLTKNYLKIIIEIGIYAGLINLGLSLFTLLIKSLGSEALVAHQIAFQVYSLTYLPANGFLIATSIIVGKLTGAEKKECIISSVIKTLIICFIFMFVLNAFLFIYAKDIATLFSPTDEKVANLATKAIKLVCLEELVCSVYLVLRGALTGIKDTRFLAIQSFFSSYIIFLPLAYLLTIKLNYGIIGGYIAFLCGTSFDSLIFIWRFFINKSWAKEN